MKSSMGDKTHYFKLVSLWIHRDEQLSQALAMEAEGHPLLEVGEQYLEVARRTAELAEALKGGSLGSIGTDILQGLAQQYYDLGGHYAADTTQAIAYAKTCEERLRDSINAQLDRIDSGEEELVPFTKDMLPPTTPQKGAPELTQMSEAFPNVGWRYGRDAVVGTIVDGFVLVVEFRTNLNLECRGAYVATLERGEDSGMWHQIFAGPPAPSAVSATKALQLQLENLAKIHPQLDSCLSK